YRMILNESLFCKNRRKECRLMQKGAISSAFCEPTGTELELFFGRFEAIKSIERKSISIRCGC
ncbi:MAG TPA: hypothetical protein VKX40_11695, partial [Aequorivita sp.]|nr:hypothetical protein [Aequorivita sp.]